MTRDVHPKILELCGRVTAKRAKTVIDHILKHGSITTEDLQDTYGYDHPPRAVRDVRENGIPIETFKVVSGRTGRKIAAYRFANPDDIKHGRIGGRQAFSKEFKETLISMLGEKNTLTGQRMEARYLQIDHRVPYEVSGDGSGEENPEAFMLLDASSQRAKSWSCEHCRNFTELLAPETCETCYWSYPESYKHVAMSQERRVDIVWSGAEVADYDALEARAKGSGIPVSLLIKRTLKG